MNGTHVVYRCFDNRDALLYIGQTGDLMSRVKWHRTRSPWWDRWNIRVIATRTTTRRAALRYERMAIRHERPRYNVLHGYAEPKCFDRSTVPPSDYIGVPEVAELLGISRAAVTRRVTAGTLTPALKMPGRTGAYLFHLEDILAETVAS